MPADSADPQGTLPSLPLSLLRSAAPWKRPAQAATVLPDQEITSVGWRVPRERLAEYRALVGSSAELPVVYPQVPIMALTMELVSRWSFPVRALGMVHMGAVVECLEALPADAPWDLRAWSTPGRHVRSGLEFDVWGEVSVDGVPAWRSRAMYLSRSRSASGAEESVVPEPPDPDGDWPSRIPVPVSSDTGRAFARISGDVNPIHLHQLTARPLGFKRAIAHGWWIAGRVPALLDADESSPGRQLEIAFRKPVELPSTPQLLARDAAGATEFQLVRGDGATLASGRIGSATLG